MKPVLALSFSIITSCGYSQQTDLPSFDIVSVKACNSPGSVEIADLNHDSLTDLVVASESDSSVTILLGAGQGNFRPSSKSPFRAGNIPNDIAIADLDKDGNPDIVVANHERKYLTMLLGDGAGNFNASHQSPLKTRGIPHTHGVAIGDFNCDKRPDIVTDSWGNDQLEVFFGDQNNLFKKEGKFFKVGKRPYQRHRVADINGDGIDDIVATNLESNDATILLSDGKGDFYQPPGSPVPCGDAPFGIAIGDLNADKRPDLAIIDSPSSTGGSKGVNGLTVLTGDGHGRFTTIKGSPFAAGKLPNRVAIGDVNRDGVNDIVTSDNGSNEIYLFVMSKNGNVISTGSIKVGNHPKGIAITETEIIVCNQEDDTISILTIR